MGDRVDVKEILFREDLHERALAAEAKAADVVDADLFGEAFFFDLLLELVEDRVGIVG
ncbi:MAG: hypothetical protein BWY66_00158 [bacterium ADurb.Bin374]|nr:MAG: hypothetical protein BWY66_00158 [bacterium ADurb.Bin374]